VISIPNLASTTRGLSENAARSASSLLSWATISASVWSLSVGPTGETSAIRDTPSSLASFKFSTGSESDPSPGRSRVKSGVGMKAHKAAERELPLASGGELSPQQARAVEAFFGMFSDLAALGVPAATLEASVAAPSAAVLGALGAALGSPFSSIDAVGAANVEHLASVFRGVLADHASSRARPLTQAEVDRLAMDTVLTDVFMKGRSAADLALSPTVPTNFGDSGGAIFAGMKAHLKAAISAEGPIGERVRLMLDLWIDRGGIPTAPAAVKKEAEAANLSPDEESELRNVWKERVLQRGRANAAQGFMQGTWLHGIPAFEQILTAVTAAGMDPTAAPGILATVLSHHMAGFVAAGFASGGLRVDFAALAAAGHIPSDAAPSLAALYDAAATLAGKWRPPIDQAALRGQGLSGEERRAYAQDAAALRAAIAALPEAGRSQLLNDDAMQFTDLGIPKWLAMGRAFYAVQGEIANGDLLRSVYAKMAQPYLEENLARGSGAAFISGTAPVATRLGMRFDPFAMTFRPAGPEDEAFHTYARLISLDPELAALMAADLHRTADLLSAREVVDWFNARPADVETLARLAGRPRL